MQLNKLTVFGLVMSLLLIAVTGCQSTKEPPKESPVKKELRKDKND